MILQRVLTYADRKAWFRTAKNHNKLPNLAFFRRIKRSRWNRNTRKRTQFIAPYLFNGQFNIKTLRVLYWPDSLTHKLSRPTPYRELSPHTIYRSTLFCGISAPFTRGLMPSFFSPWSDLTNSALSAGNNFNLKFDAWNLFQAKARQGKLRRYITTDDPITLEHTHTRSMSPWLWLITCISWRIFGDI